MFLVIGYLIILLITSVYSFSLVDPNITFFNHHLWTSFRNIMVNFGYNQRHSSWLVYLGIIILLFLFNYLIVKHKQIPLTPIKLALLVGLILSISYPFLSHDLFSYMFYARIATIYHHNPYTYMAGDFYLDPWLRFTQWTGNNYPYGLIFLLISLLPSFLGFGKFALTFFLFKIINVIFYLLAVWFLQKINKKWALMFLTNPLIIIEGLINSHNDLIGLSLLMICIYYFLKKHQVNSLIFLSLSIGIKYLTLPFIFLFNRFKNKKLVLIIMVLLFLLLLIIKSEIQPWYFLLLFGLIPFYDNLIFRFNIFFFGLLVSYYPYVRFGGWGKVLYWTTQQKIDYKHNVIIVFTLINLMYLLFLLFKDKIFNQMKLSSNRRVF